MPGHPEKTCQEAVVIVSHPGAAQPATELGALLASARAQAAAACARSLELQQWTTHVLTEARAARRISADARHQRRVSPAGRDLMQQPAITPRTPGPHAGPDRPSGRIVTPDVQGR